MIYDVIVVGAGPAGISASIYATSRGLNTLVLEKNQVGGTIRPVSTVTHYSGIQESETGKSFSQRLNNQAINSGANIRFEEVVSIELDKEIKEITTGDNKYQAKAIIIAGGTTPKHIGIPGEEEFIGKGISYCLSDNIEMYRDREVFVVGGADGAIKEALFLSKIASKVTIIHFEEKLGAIAEFTSKVYKTSNITVKLNSRLTAVKGSESIEELEITDVNTGKSEAINSRNSFVFIYAGSTPNSELYPLLNKEKGYIVVNSQMETNIPGVYAVGDISTKQVRQIATAVSDGAIAGIRVAAYIKEL
ncbi:MAG: NAD(P)/FAD-dependent oxidoreductase [Clostridium sp.]